MNFSLATARTYARAHWFLLVMSALGAVILALALFEAGIMVGYHEARFSYGLDRNYERTFGAPGPMQGGLPAAHGSVGAIVRVALPDLTIAAPNGPEVQVRVSSSTLIRNQNNTVSSSALLAGDVVVVLGEPDEDDGTVQARLIRIMPTPVSATASSTARK